MFIRLDIAADCLDEFRAFCALNNIVITHVLENGPGGGNPEVSLTVYDGDALRALAVEYFDEAGV